jgi:hypothetical protein
MKKQKKTWSHLGTALALAVLAGALAGLITSIIVSDSIDQYILSLQDNRTILQLTDTQREPLPGTYEEALMGLQDEIWPSIVYTFAPGAEWEWTEFQAIGTVMTSDGWLLFHQDAFTLGSALSRNYYVDGTVYQAEEVVTDALTASVMVRIDAQGLQANGLTETEDYNGGEMIFVPREEWAVIPSVVASAHHHREDIGSITSAETMTQTWEIVDWDEMPVSIAFDPAGDLAALVGANSVHAMHEVVSFVNAVLRSGESQHAGLGLYVRDESRLIQEVEGDQALYAVVTSVLGGGPGALAGVEIGDHILSVNSESLDRRSGLGEILSQYRSGDQVTLAIERDGGLRTLSVELGVFEELAY